jgi:hypothetical protein
MFATIRYILKPLLAPDEIEINTGRWACTVAHLRQVNDFYLHRLIAPIYARTVNNYYKGKGIQIQGHLKCEMTNRRVLKFVAYACKRAENILGMPRLLEKIVKIPARDNRTYEQFHNLLVEFHMLKFAEKQLRIIILEVEHESHQIFSPRRKKNTLSCDMLGLMNRQQVYLEAKDSSSETKNAEEYHGFMMSTPKNAYQHLQWIRNKVYDAEQKGADYLVCKVPMWLKFSETSHDWMCEVFDDVRQEGKNLYSGCLKGLKIDNLKSIFILQLWSAIRFNIRKL